MSIPGRVESAVLLLSLEPPAWFLHHSRAVAEIAAWLAERISVAGSPIDRGLVEASALLHDVDKLLPHDDRGRRLPHGDGSAAWLEHRGHAELAPVVAAHPVTKLADRGYTDGLVTRAPIEARVVAYADKRAGQRIEPLEARFASWGRRYPPTGSPEERSRSVASATAMLDGALALERAVCAAARIQPDDVRRLRWTGRALDQASRLLARGKRDGQDATAGRRASRAEQTKMLTDAAVGRRPQ